MGYLGSQGKVTVYSYGKFSSGRETKTTQAFHLLLLSTPQLGGSMNPDDRII